MKKLYIIAQDGGDGSTSLRYTMNAELIAKLEEAADDERMTYENGIGIDGDGFHYDTLTIPDECTYASLGIRFPLADDYADRFFK